MSRFGRIKTWSMVSVVLAAHVVVLGPLFTNGCGTTQPVADQPPLPPTQPKLTPPIRIPEEMPTVTRKPAATQNYKVAKGDSLALIAQKYGITVSEITELNGMKKTDKLYVGRTLLLPAYAKAKAIAPKKTVDKKPAVKQGAPVAAGADTYTVARGDTLSEIAAKHGTTTKALRDLNKLTSDRIMVDQKLLLPAKKGAAPAAAEKPEAGTTTTTPAPTASTPPPAVTPAPATVPESEMPTYTVMPGDDLDKIAQLYGIPADKIREVNKLDRPVQAGDVLKIPQDR